MRFLLLALLALTACENDISRPPEPNDSAWTIGPIINGTNYSANMPLRPDPHPEGWSFDFGPDAEPHYVTFGHGSLAGKSVIRMRYRVETDAVIHGKGCTSPSAVTLYFQRQGDNWGKDGWRWWATFASKELSGPGEWEITAPLDGLWTSVLVQTAETSPDEFADAKREAGNVGFTFANCEGYGHGARATGPVRFVVTEFTVE